MTDRLGGWRRCCLAGALVFVASLAAAQGAYPARPIKLVVPYPPGALTDLLARAIGERLGAALKEPVIIDNKPGAGTLVGAEFVAKQPPGRLYAADGDVDDARHQPGDVQAVADQSGPGFRADRADRLRRFLPDRQSGFSREDGARDDRRGQARARQIQLCVGRQRQPASPVHGGVEVGARPRHPARSVQGHVGGDDRPPDGTGADDVRRRDARGPEHPGRQAHRPWDFLGDADDAAPRGPAGGRDRPRLRLEGLAGHRRAGRNAGGRHRPAGRRDTEDPGHCPTSRSSSTGSAMEPAAANTPAEFAAVIRAEQPRWAKAVKDSGAKVD